MANLYEQEFWNEEERNLWRDIIEIVVLTLLAGGESGINTLPPEARLLISWDVFNTAAIEYLNLYRLNTIFGISETTRKQVMRAIEAWIREGAALPALEARLIPIFGEQRVSTIATTEVTRIYSQGNQMMWASSGVVGEKRWMTARDELVCPICAPLDNTIVALEGNWFIPIPGAGGLGEWEPKAGPPAHVNCLPGNSLVLPIGGIAAASKRLYEGDIIIIKTAKNELAVTPNHPILTRNGWIAASKLNQGDDVLENLAGQRESALFQINNHNMMPRIENVFESIGLIGFRVPTSTPDFHGDGANSEITVIRPNREIMNWGISHATQPIAQNNLIVRDTMGFASLNSLGPSALFGERDFTPTGGFMGGSDLGSTFPCGHPRPLNQLGLGLTTRDYSGLHQPGAEGEAVDARFLSQSIFGLPGHIAAEQIIEIRNEYFSGHVYNLQTDSGMFFANNIITHNCRCRLLPVVSIARFEERLERILAAP